MADDRWSSAEVPICARPAVLDGGVLARRSGAPVSNHVGSRRRRELAVPHADYGHVVRGLLLVGVLVFVASCGDDDDEGSDLAEAFCADLDSGMSIAQILSGVEPGQFGEGQELAARIGVWVEDGCPEHLQTNKELRGYLEANGLNTEDFGG